MKIDFNEIFFFFREKPQAFHRDAVHRSGQHVGQPLLVATHLRGPEGDLPGDRGPKADPQLERHLADSAEAVLVGPSAPLHLDYLMKTYYDVICSIVFKFNNFSLFF